MDPQDRAIKVLVRLIQSHQGLLGTLKSMTQHGSINLRTADIAFEDAGKLLNDLRLGEIKVEHWVRLDVLWCVECGNSWEGDPDGECPECGGQCTDA
jgi:rubrerythrin